MTKKKLKVSAIKEGTVIDRIPAKSLFKVINILKLNQTDNQVTFGTNLDSDKLGQKAIIKVADMFFADEELNKISLIAPHAKLNIIKDYEVIEKRTVEIPSEIEGIVKCFNPKCITHTENMPTRFTVIEQSPIEIKCHYCEKHMVKDQIEIL